jgi:hypothetical protein
MKKELLPMGEKINHQAGKYYLMQLSLSLNHVNT